MKFGCTSDHACPVFFFLNSDYIISELRILLRTVFSVTVNQNGHDNQFMLTAVWSSPKYT